MQILVVNGSPKLKAKAGSAMTDGMLMPYRKVLEQAKQECTEKP